MFSLPNLGSAPLVISLAGERKGNREFLFFQKLTKGERKGSIFAGKLTMGKRKGFFQVKSTKGERKGFYLDDKKG